MARQKKKSILDQIREAKNSVAKFLSGQSKNPNVKKAASLLLKVAPQTNNLVIQNILNNNKDVANIGKYLQKTPDTTAKITKKATPKSMGRAKIGPVELPVSQLGEKATPLLTGMVGESVRGVGRLLEKTHTQEGKRELAGGAKELMTKQVPNIIRNPKNTKNYLDVLQNPVVDVGLTASDFLPGVGVGSVSLKKFLKKGGKEIVEDAGSKYLAKNKDLLKAQYRQQNQGKLLNTDDVREVFQPAGYTRKNSAEFHESSSKLASELFDEDVANLKPGDNYLFTAGSSGAGKSKALESYPTMTQGVTKGLDGNFSSKSSLERLDKVVKSGANVAIAFVHRNPVDAWLNGVVKRAENPQNGRVVPLDVFVDNLVDSPKRVLEAFKKYGNKITIGAFDNNYGPGNARLADNPIDFIQNIKYNKDDVKQTLINETVKAFKEGRISEENLRYLLGKDYERVSSQLKQERTSRTVNSSSSQSVDPSILQNNLPKDLGYKMNPPSNQALPNQKLQNQIEVGKLGSHPQSQKPAGNDLPSQQSSFSSDNSISDPVKKVIDALKGSKSIRGQQDKLYSKERAKRFGEVMGVRRNSKGESGYFQELSKLKGELPKAEFESLRGKVTQGDVDSLFNMVRDADNVDEWDKLAAFQGLSKVLGRTGGTVPTQNELKLLNDVFGKEFTDAVMSKRTSLDKVKGWASEAINIPRTFMSTLDFSAPLRQGIFMVGKPKQFLPAFVSMFKQWGSEKAYKAVQESIRNKSTYRIMKQNKLALTDIGSLGTREEAFLSSWGERMWVIKYGVKSSNRAYTGFLNKLRADVFDDLYKKGQAMGLDEDPKFARDLADFINNATGRGNLGRLESSARVLNGVFFSPRLMASRLNLMNPAYYIKLQPQVRKEALKSLFTFAGLGMTIVTLAKAGGADVSADPRSPDFGKIKFGNTRYDVWGGFQQYIRLAGQLITGQMVNSNTGTITRLGDNDEYKPTTRLDIAERFVEGKSAPVMSFILDLLRNSNFVGEPLDFDNPNPFNNPIGQRFLPMVSQDIWDAWKEYGTKGLGISAPAIFGVGSQTYGGVNQIDSPEQAEGQGPVMLYNYLKTKMSKDEANKYAEKLAKESPQKYSKLEKFKAIEEAGLGENEMRMVGTGIKDGERAGLITNQLNKLQTKQEKNEYINKLYDLGIMDDEDRVWDQLVKLKEQGKLKPPTDAGKPSEAVAPESVEEMQAPRSIINSETLPVTQAYGNYNPEIEIFSGGVNYGTDFGVNENTELSLPEGVWEVVEAYDGDDMNSGYGKSIMVENRRTGERIRLSHLNDVLADKGELLKGGETIGFSGSTGNSTGPHVDVEFYDEDGNMSDILRSQYAKNL